MGEIDELRQSFPDLFITPLSDIGANIQIRNKTVTVYWKKQKYGIGSIWKQYAKFEDFLSVVDEMVNPKPKVAPVVIKQAETSNGVQSCIDHIKRKAEYGQKNNLNASNIAMLNSLAEELKQYL